MDNSDRNTGEVMMEIPQAVPNNLSLAHSDSDSDKEKVLESLEMESFGDQNPTTEVSTNISPKDEMSTSVADIEKETDPTVESTPVDPLSSSVESTSMELDQGESETLEVATTATSESEDKESATVDVPTAELSDAAKKFAEQEAQLNSYLEEIEKSEREKEAELARKNKPVSPVPTLSNSDPNCNLNGKPRRKTIAELLKSMPGNLLNKKPVIRQTFKHIIDFTEDFKTIDNTRKKGIEDLMHRFDIHTAVSKPSKEEHYKIHITKKEEDSQGITHVHTDETEYVKVIPDEEIEEMTSPQVQAPGVKMGQVKAKLMSEIRANRAKAYEEKVKVYAMYSEEKELEEKGDEEEEEILLDDDITDDEDDDDEEINSDGELVDKKLKKKKKKKSKSEVDKDTGEGEIENSDDDASSSSDQDLEEDEDVEALLDGAPKEKKKARKRLVYLEEEADESDQGEVLSNDEDEDRLDRERKEDLAFIDDRPVDDSTDEETDEDSADSKKPSNNLGGGLHDSSQSLGFDTQSQVQDEDQSQSQNGKLLESQSCASQDLFSDFEKEITSQRATMSTPSNANREPLPSFLDPNKTPVISASILSNSHGPSPLGPWNSITSINDHSSVIRHPGSHISPLIPRLNSDAALEAFCQDHPDNNPHISNHRKQSPALPAEVAKLVGTQPTIPTSQSAFDDVLEGICSARFPSQPVQAPMESQEFDCFGFEEDFETDAAMSQIITDPSTPQSSTPISSSVSVLAARDTPRTTTTDRAPRNTRLNFNVTDVKTGNTNTPVIATSTVQDNDAGTNVESDVDDDDTGVKIPTKRKRKRLQFSDDEDDDSDDVNNDAKHSSESEDEDMNTSEDKVQFPETDEDAVSVQSEVDDLEDSDKEIEYDENEEEIIQPKFKGLMSRKTGMLRKEFVEGEAELSGSEEGSDDEDERGLGEYEDEVADQEEFDEDLVRDQNARVFNKLELDEDQRDIRDLENRFLENGDLHMEGNERERKFKWKNIDESKLDDYKDDDVEEDAEEDDVEKQRRKEHKETMKAIQSEGGENGNGVEEILKKFEDEASQIILGDSQFLRLSTKSKSKSSFRKSVSISTSRSFSVTAISNSVLESENSDMSTLKCKAVASEKSHPNPHSIIPDTSPSTTFQRKGSFLLRETTLTRQAEMFRVSDSVNLKKGKSFVFAVVTPPTEAEKKKSNDKDNNNPKSNRARHSQPNKIIKTDIAAVGGGQRESGSIFKWI